MVSGHCKSGRGAGTSCCDWVRRVHGWPLYKKERRGSLQQHSSKQPGSSRRSLTRVRSTDTYGLTPVPRCGGRQEDKRTELARRHRWGRTLINSFLGSSFWQRTQPFWCRSCLLARQAGAPAAACYVTYDALFAVPGHACAYIRTYICGCGPAGWKGPRNGTEALTVDGASLHGVKKY